MNGKQIAAVAVAIALIGGAIGVRQLIDGDDDEPTDPTASTSPPPVEAGAVICITELEAVCNALDEAGRSVEVESAFTTLDRLATLDDGDDVPTWVTVAPFPAMVDVLRTSENRDPLALTSTEVAASPLAVAVPTGRGEAIETTCAAPTWRCIGDADSWQELGVDTNQRLVVGIGDAEESVVAFASLAAAASGYFGTRVSTAELQADPGFGRWFGSLVTSAPLGSLSGGTPLATLLTRPSAVNVAATSGSEVATFSDASGEIDLNYPAPAMWLQAVVAGPPDDDLSSLATATLVDAGWEPAASATDTLPSANTMFALLDLWKDAL